MDIANIWGGLLEYLRGSNIEEILTTVDIANIWGGLNYLGDIDNSGYCKYLAWLIRILAAGWLPISI